jgi:diketogulonate reductase-like aldo/keto reductase
MSKIVLGTVQFGLNYGITNQAGQAKISDVREILDFAKESGIDTLDTASLYGNCEQVLGEIGINDFNVITKTTALKDSIWKVIDDFRASLEDFGQKQVEVAEKLIEIIPCAEKVRFAKNGTDATSAAIRLARAYKGKEHIAVCGYHG